MCQQDLKFNVPKCRRIANSRILKSIPIWELNQKELRGWKRIQLLILLWHHAQHANLHSRKALPCHSKNSKNWNNSRMTSELHLTLSALEIGFAKDATTITFRSETTATCVILVMKPAWKCFISWILAIKAKKVVITHQILLPITLCQSCQNYHKDLPQPIWALIHSLTNCRHRWEIESYTFINISTHTRFNHRINTCNNQEMGKASSRQVWLIHRQRHQQVLWLLDSYLQRSQMASTLLSPDSQCLSGDPTRKAELIHSQRLLKAMSGKLATSERNKRLWIKRKTNIC